MIKHNVLHPEMPTENHLQRPPIYRKYCAMDLEVILPLCKTNEIVVSGSN
jgi:hypothetical protein